MVPHIKQMFDVSFGKLVFVGLFASIETSVQYLPLNSFLGRFAIRFVNFIKLTVTSRIYLVFLHSNQLQELLQPSIKEKYHTMCN